MGTSAKILRKIGRSLTWPARSYAGPWYHGPGRGTTTPSTTTIRVRRMSVADPPGRLDQPTRHSTGEMFLLWWNTLSGSYLALTSASRR
jgi:hypothetical protein